MVDSSPSSKVAPFVRHSGEGWLVCDEGAALLREVKEPVVVIAIAGLYRTGKSFLLNCIIGATGAKPALPVGSTSESCTRGIDVCVTPTRLANGARLVLLDTEGLASMEQDEAYDAQVFALALLLSSYFVLNSMGVLDEAAIDRLYLISELSKHVCVRTDAAKAMQHSGGEAAGGGGGGADDGAALAAAEADLAQFFPPLLWVLRDFVVDLVADGRPISQDEYMEKALEPRPTTARRADERNRVRAAIRTLFPRRACVTLVRPAADESAVRHAVDLAQSELRPEFVSGMRAIQARLLGAAYAHGPAELAGASASGNGLTAGGGSAGGAPVKKLFGAELSGAHLAALAQQYVGALNTAGVVPSIRGAWEYVVADACRQAKETAMRAHSANLARALAGGGAAAGGGPAADAGSAEAQAQAGPVREAEELLLAVAQPSGIAARESYRRAAIAGPDADATLAQLEAEIATADGRAVGALADASNDSCAAAAERLGARLEAALAEAGAEAEAEAVEGAGAGAQPDVRARARDELPRALRLYAQGYAAEASGPAKARVLQEAIKGRVAAAVEGAVRRLDGSAREALAAAAAERAALAVRLAACEASLEARTAALEAATAERAQARADADDLKAQLQAQGALLAEARAARAVAEAEMAASARAAAAELAAAKAEAAGEREGRERAAQLLDDARAQAAAEAQRATEAQRGVEAQLAEAREQLVISRADTERAAERLASAQRESDSALAAARAAADSSTADCELLRGQLAALTAQLQAATQLHAAAEAHAAREAQAAAERHAADVARAAASGAQLLGAERTHVGLLVKELSLIEGSSAGAAAALQHAEEERKSLASQLADFHDRLSVLPEFYVQQIFCAEKKPNDLLDALAPDSDGSQHRLEELAGEQFGKIKDVVTRRFAGWFGGPREGAPGSDEDEYTAEQVLLDMQAERASRAPAPPAQRTYGPLA